jgi:integrase
MRHNKPASNAKPSFSLYEDLYQEMVQYAKAKGMTVDEALNHALDFFLDIHS